MYTVSEHEYSTPSKDHYWNGGMCQKKKSANILTWTYIFKEFEIFPKRYCQSLYIKGLQDLKKFCRSAWVIPHTGGSGSIPEWWDHSQSLMDHNIAALWPTETDRTSLEDLIHIDKHAKAQGFWVLYFMTPQRYPFPLFLFTRGAIFIFGNCICQICNPF